MKILTKKRKEILDLLLSSEKPMCANMLKKYVAFNLSTIYRALEYLESNNFISSFYFGNEKYYFKEKNGNFFLCESCNTIEVVPSEVIKENDKNISKKTGFSLISHLFLFKGKCPNCMDKKNIIMKEG